MIQNMDSDEEAIPYSNISDSQETLIGLSDSLSRRLSVPSQVADVLREMIFSNKLRQGERVIETKIARALRIGQPTVREALKTLEIEGLVVRYPNRGCVVTELTREEYEKLIRFRVELEVLAVDLAIDSWSGAKAKALGTVLEQFKKAAEAGDLVDFCRCDREFHQCIWRFAENQYLERSLTQVVTPLFAFVMMRSLQGPAEANIMVGFRHHETLCHAILACNKAKAVQLMRSEMERALAAEARLFTPTAGTAADGRR
jgi:DNA-binding GntR family transcriptional regulator